MSAVPLRYGRELRAVVFHDGKNSYAHYYCRRHLEEETLSDAGWLLAELGDRVEVVERRELRSKMRIAERGNWGAALCSACRGTPAPCLLLAALDAKTSAATALMRSALRTSGGRAT